MRPRLPPPPAATALLRALLLAVLLLPFLAPLLLTLAGSLHPPGRVPTAGALWPEEPGLAAYAAAFALLPLARGLANSALVALLYLPLALSVAACGAYGLCQMGPRARAWALALLVLAASVPAAVTWLPRFWAFHQLGWADTWLPLLAPALYGGSPLLLLLYYVAMRHVPQSQIDAARLEGLGHAAVLWRVVLPQVRPATYAVAVLALAWCWASFEAAQLYLQSPQMQTAPALLYQLELLGASHRAALLAAAAVLAAPMLLLALWLPAALDRSLEEH